MIEKTNRMKFLALVLSFILQLKLFETFHQPGHVDCLDYSKYLDSTALDYFRKLYERKLNGSEVSKSAIKLRTDMLSLLRYFQVTPCGDMDVEPDSSIVYGTDAPEKAWPWQTLVYSANLLCGGVLISDRWVLTAAHCFDETETYHVEVGTRVFGSTGGAVKRAAEIFVVHKGYSDNVSHDDIALIKLNSKVPLNARIRPACLPLDHEFNESQLCYITGFGLGAPGVNATTALQQLRVLVVPLRECVYFWNVLSTPVDKRNICVGRVRQQGGACLGDSGGPLSCKVDNKYYVVGITSFGPTEDCLEGLIPDVYTRVSEYINWIFSVITKYEL